MGITSRAMLLKLEDLSNLRNYIIIIHFPSVEGQAGGLGEQ